MLSILDPCILFLWFSVANIKVAKPEKAAMVESMIVRMAQTGQLAGKVSAVHDARFVYQFLFFVFFASLCFVVLIGNFQHETFGLLPWRKASNDLRVPKLLFLIWQCGWKPKMENKGSNTDEIAIGEHWTKVYHCLLLLMVPQFMLWWVLLLGQNETACYLLVHITHSLKLSWKYLEL